MATAIAVDIERLKEAVDIVSVVGRYVQLRRNGNANEWVGLCPFHKERTPSFTVTSNVGLYHCFGCKASGDVFTFVQQIEGCTFAEAVERVADIAGYHPPRVNGKARQAQSAPPPLPTHETTTTVEPRVVATYPYVDERGDLLFEVQRLEPGLNGKPKSFRQRRPHPVDGAWVWGIKAGRYRRGADGWYPAHGDEQPGDDELPEVRRVLYRLPEVLAADTVYVVEGEKDADTLAGHGLVATTNAGGASQQWLPEYTEALRGKRVVVLPDQDEPGRKRGAMIASALTGVASEVVVVNVPDGKDVTEYLARHSVDELLDLVEARRLETRREALERRGLFSPSEIIELFEGGVNAFLDQSQRQRGVETGFYRLDQMTLGLKPGEMFVLAARPAMGKTAMALNIAEHAASRRHVVAFFSLEMSRDQILTRLVCSRARIDQTRFRAGYLNADEERRARVALTEICEMPIFIDDAPGCDLRTMRKKLETLRASRGLGLVVVDYLQLMRTQTRDSRNLEVGALSRGLKGLARELRVPFLVLSQLSRAPEARHGNHRPQLSDLRDSGEIEQDADVVAFIFREEVYKPDREDLRGRAELIVAKQRNGPTGVIPLVFLRSYTRFENPVEDK